MLLWFCLKPETQIALIMLYQELEGKEFKPPPDDFREKTLTSLIEKPEEIDKLMRQTRGKF